MEKEYWESIYVFLPVLIWFNSWKHRGEQATFNQIATCTPTKYHSVDQNLKAIALNYLLLKNLHSLTESLEFFLSSTFLCHSFFFFMKEMVKKKCLFLYQSSAAAAVCQNPCDILSRCCENYNVKNNRRAWPVRRNK